MPNIKCPACPRGYYTTTPNYNLLNHIKNIAKTELLIKFLLGEGKIPHANFLKDNFEGATTQVQHLTIRVGDKKIVLGTKKKIA